MQRALQMTVIVCAAVLVFAKWMPPNREHSVIELSEPRDVDRNERSTPRSFVLPATPGLSFEQERQVAGKDMRDQITICVGKLKHLGYDVGNGRPLVNVQLIEAVYRFQTTQQLPATGSFDPATMKIMGCL